MTQTGFLSSVEFDPAANKMSVNAGGPQTVGLRHSKSISYVRVYVRDKTLYEGAPINQIDAMTIGKEKLYVAFQWTGDRANIGLSYEFAPEADLPRPPAAIESGVPFLFPIKSK